MKIYLYIKKYSGNQNINTNESTYIKKSNQSLDNTDNTTNRKIKIKNKYINFRY